MGALDAHAQRGSVDVALIAEFDTDRVRDEEVARLIRGGTVAALAAAIPRRLGQDASPAELARDKKLARRMASVCSRVGREWIDGRFPTYKQPDAEMRAAAAQVDWGEWAEETSEHLERRRTYVATLCKATGQRQFGNRAMHLYQMELDALAYALRK